MSEKRYTEEQLNEIVKRKSREAALEAEQNQKTKWGCLTFVLGFLLLYVIINGVL